MRDRTHPGARLLGTPRHRHRDAMSESASAAAPQYRFPSDWDLVALRAASPRQWALLADTRPSPFSDDGEDGKEPPQNSPADHCDSMTTATSTLSAAFRSASNASGAQVLSSYRSSRAMLTDPRAPTERRSRRSSRVLLNMLRSRLGYETSCALTSEGCRTSWVA